MTKQEKAQVIDELTQVLQDNNIIYLTDIQGLNAKDTYDLRLQCFKNDIKLQVVKNTLLKKAMESVEAKDFSELFETLHGNTALMISTVSNEPAKLIQTFRKKSEKPILKGAWIDESVYIGDKEVANLIAIKSKEELIGEIIGLLQSPAKNVISALKSGGSTIAGLVKTLSEKSE